DIVAGSLIGSSIKAGNSSMLICWIIRCPPVEPKFTAHIHPGSGKCTGQPIFRFIKYLVSVKEICINFQVNVFDLEGISESTKELLITAADYCPIPIESNVVIPIQVFKFK